MKKWLVLILAMMMLIGCGGGGGSSGSPSGSSSNGDSDGSGGEECIALALPDDFERDFEPGEWEFLSEHCSGKWMHPDRYEVGTNSYFEFKAEEGGAYATGTINVNLWDEVFPSDQAVRFIIKEVPSDSNISSLGVLLRINLDHEDGGNGYLVTFVPMDNADDEIRVWLIEDGDLSTTNGLIATQSAGRDFMAGDEIHVQIVDDQVLVQIMDNEENLYPNIICNYSA